MDFWNDLWSNDLFQIVLNVGLAALVVILARWLARRLRTWVQVALRRTTLTETLIQMAARGAYFGTLLGGVLIALSVVGIPISGLLGGTGLLIVILGLALQEALADFASTVLFMLFQPFKTGDIIETNGVTGTVREIQLFSCIIQLADNKLVTIPTSNMRKANLINYTQLGTLRADVNVAVSYEDDLAQVRRVLSDIIAADARVLPSPAPQIVVAELGADGVVVSVRAFVATSDYWQIRTDLMERIKLRFDEAGITIPYPQRMMHLVNSPAAPASNAG